MKQLNSILFIVLSMLFLLGWTNFVMPRLAPKKPVAKPAAVAKTDAGKAEDTKKPAAAAASPAKSAAAAPAKKEPAPAKGAPEKAAAADKVAGAQKKSPLPQFPSKTIVLGSSDPGTGYFLRVALASKGGSVTSIQFNDPRYRELKNAKLPLEIVGADLDQRLRKSLQDRDAALTQREIAARHLKETEAQAQGGDSAARESIRVDQASLAQAEEDLQRAEVNLHLAQFTFNTAIPDVDALLEAKGDSVAKRDWSVAETTVDPAVPGVNKAVTFRYPSPDGKLVVEKRYSLVPVARAGEGNGASRAAQNVRDSDPAGYLLHLDITLKNVGTQKLTTSYVLQGPVGMPLENVENAQKFHDIKQGFLTGPGVVTAGKTKTAAQIIADEEKKKPEEWKAPLKYIGVDVQYFTALIEPEQDQLTDRTVERSIPIVLDRPADKLHTDLSVQLDSVPVALAPQASVTHRYELFAGPKRQRLLEPIGADAVLDYGWFARVSHVMLALLQFFHGLGFPYGVAIICLTVLVRACMFPVSLRQTAQAQRMKEMQPKLQEIKKKYANDKEKLAVANLELMRKYKINPLGGCLPLLLQFPVFIGLYQALNNAVDLRRAPFLYFDNLAAPDALFHLPFTVPWFGWTEFNLLPIITVVLFVVQQKMFMPPPTDEQQEMQYKMMNVMTIVMGVMFYRVPAGLCVYFIASSLWGIGERNILNWWKSRLPAPALDEAPEEQAENSSRGRGKVLAVTAEKEVNGVRHAAGSFWKRLLSAADAAGAEATSGSKGSISRRKTGPGKKNGKRPR